MNDAINQRTCVKPSFCCFMMASYFGEILEPTSRAIFEEFSDEEEDVNVPELRFTWLQTEDQLPQTLNAIFLYHGKLSLAFAEAYLFGENSFPIGEITKVGQSETGNNQSKSLPSRIYINDNTLTCLISPSHSADEAYQFVNAVLPLLQIAKKVVIFTNESCNNFRAASLRDLPPAFIRELKTSHTKSNFIVEELPVPNIVAGIPAALASWCQIFKKDASLFVCFADQQKLDSVTAMPYLSVLRKLNHHLIKNEQPDVTRRRFYGNPDVIGGASNIYI